MLRIIKKLGRNKINNNEVIIYFMKFQFFNN